VIRLGKTKMNVSTAERGCREGGLGLEKGLGFRLGKTKSDVSTAER